MPAQPDYFVAPFTPDGELVGVAGRLLEELSPKWLAFCRDLLATGEITLRCAIPLPPLQHITLKLTSSNGAALISLSVHDQLATSAVALSGSDPVADSEVLQMFVQSMRRLPIVRQSASTPTPFEAVFSLAQRPLYVVIPWGSTGVSEADQQLVQEITWPQHC